MTESHSQGGKRQDDGVSCHDAEAGEDAQLSKRLRSFEHRPPPAAYVATSAEPRVPLPLFIGMPVYNGQRYLRKALDSVLGQTYRRFELVISDNASTDDSAA